MKEMEISSYPDDKEDLASLVEDIKTAFRGESAKIFLLELVGVATADMELHPKEETLLREFAGILSLTENLPEFVELARESHQLQDRLRRAVRDDHFRTSSVSG